MTNKPSTITSSNHEKISHEKVVILGSGPAGLSAALYAARAELHPIVISGIELGGQASLTNTIENYPGFPDGVGGAELGELFQKQAERFGARVEFSTATDVDVSKRPFLITTDSGKYFADSLIVATGAIPNHLNIPGEKELTGRGVSYCGTCDGWFFKEKHVAVVGGGDSALEEALFLTRFVTSIKIIHRRDTLRASAILQKRAKENPKISFVWNSIVEEIQGSNAVSSLIIKNTVSGEKVTEPVDGLFIFIGHTPNTEMFKNQLEMDELGFLKANMLMETSVAGVFAAGEVADSHFRQVITSAGMGAAAAIQATHFLEKE
jgi:thioredoxin reductase (NADPH)